MKPLLDRWRKLHDCKHSYSLGSINHPADEVTWLSAAIRFLESVDDDFLVQVIQKPISKGTLPDLLLTNKEEPDRNVKIKGSLGTATIKLWSSKSLEK